MSSNISDLDSITINGGCFKNSLSIELFNNSIAAQNVNSAPSKNSTSSIDKRICIIYGRNGSGKTTISKAIKEATSNLEYFIFGGESNLFDKKVSLRMYSKDKQVIKNFDFRIYVFNEDFINENLYIDNDEGALKSIVLVGSDVENKKMLKIKQKELEKKSIELNSLTQEITNIANNPTNKFNLSSIDREIRKKISQYHKENYKRIENRQRYSDDNFEKVENAQPYSLSDSENLIDASKSLSNDIASFCKIRNEQGKFYAKFNEIFLDVSILKTAISLISKHVEPKSLSKRDLQIIDITRSFYDVSNLDRAKTIFSDKDVKTCPFCFQHISDDYKSDLFSHIERILDKTVTDYKNSLSLVKERVPHSIEFDYCKYSLELLSQDNQQSFKIGKFYESLNRINEFLVALHKGIDTKINQPYDDLDYVPSLPQDAIDELLSIIKAVNSLVDKREELLRNLEEEKNSLSLKNDQIARLAINHDLLVRKDAANYIDQLHTKHKNIQSEIDSLNKEISDIHDKLNDTSKAADMINSYLSMVTWSNKRLSIEIDDDFDTKNNNYKRYILKSGGVPIKVQEGSTGERNILALCYFFVRMCAYSNESDSYSKERLIVLDDPISSFDNDNRIGVWGFLSEILQAILDCSNHFGIIGNKNSKLILLTHELRTAAFFSNVFDKSITNAFYLTNSSCISEGNFNKFNEYSVCFNSVYNFACQEGQSLSNNLSTDIYFIGNQIRKIFEGYFSFNYDSPKYYQFIKDESWLNNHPALLAHQKAFRGNLFRFYADDSSHLSDKEKLGFIDFSDREIVKMCRQTICFFYLLDPKHVNAFIAGNHSVQDKKLDPELITSWLTELES